MKFVKFKKNITYLSYVYVCVCYRYKICTRICIHTIHIFGLSLLGACVYVFLVSTNIFMIPKAIISLPNFSLICLICIFLLAQRTRGYYIDTWQFTFGKLSSSVSYLSKFFCCIFLGLATSKLFCPWFSIKSSGLFCFVFLIAFLFFCVFLSKSSFHACYHCHPKLSIWTTELPVPLPLILLFFVVIC